VGTLPELVEVNIAILVLFAESYNIALLCLAALPSCSYGAGGNMFTLDEVKSHL
jgi:hypothetical protein